MISLDGKAMKWLLIAGVAGAALLYYERKKIGNAINPASTSNVVAQAGDSLTQTLTQGKNLTLGGWVYSLFHPNQAAQITHTTQLTPGSVGWYTSMGYSIDQAKILSANYEPVLFPTGTGG